MKPASTLLLEFNAPAGDPDGRKRLRDGLSAVLQIGSSLWLANDESASLERLTLSADGGAGIDHMRFAVEDFLDLPRGSEGDGSEAPEIDIEGLDHDGDYLWLTGSHSLKRDKPDADEGPKAAHKALAGLSAEANRYLLARIPLPAQEDVPAPSRKLRAGDRTLVPARLRAARKGGGNPLTDLLRKDKHFGPFLRLPGKDNGFDIEGLAVKGDRVFLGLRGPVLRGWAAILELRVADDEDKPGRLRLCPVDGSRGRRLRKHFLDLGGRGVRDLYRDGDDLLILAGPTMDLDGTIALFRWPGALKADGPSLVQAAALEHLLDLPNGAGCDRAEGITFFTAPGRRGAPQLLVVYDAAAPARQRGANAVLADVFELPRLGRRSRT